MPVFFDFKYFFTSGYQSDTGASVANTSVKDMIAELALLEDKSAPLSDQEFVKKLADKGITIARRTVAKYREAMRIPSSVQRRRDKQAEAAAS